MALGYHQTGSVYCNPVIVISPLSVDVTAYRLCDRALLVPQT